MSTRWNDVAGRPTGEEYAAHFERLADAGSDVHGEATFCAALLRPGASVLDAGCGTGRVAIRMAELGFDVVGVDADPSMVTVARRRGPQVRWVLGDLADLAGETGETGDERCSSGSLTVSGGPFGLVVMAGNVVPLVAVDTLPRVVAGLSALLAADGTLVAGFGLDRGHLPPGCPVTPWDDYERACVRSGLRLTHRYATWGRGPVGPEDGYVVAVHRREHG